MLTSASNLVLLLILVPLTMSSSISSSDRELLEHKLDNMKVAAEEVMEVLKTLKWNEELAKLKAIMEDAEIPKSSVELSYQKEKEPEPSGSKSIDTLKDHDKEMRWLPLASSSQDMTSSLPDFKGIGRMQAEFNIHGDDNDEEDDLGASIAHSPRSLPEKKSIERLQARMDSLMLAGEEGSNSPYMSSLGYLSGEEELDTPTGEGVLLSSHEFGHRREDSSASLAEWEKLSRDPAELDHNRSFKFPGRRVGPAEVSTALERMSAAEKWGVTVAPKGRRAPWGSPTLLPTDATNIGESDKFSIDDTTYGATSPATRALKTLIHGKEASTPIIHQYKSDIRTTHRFKFEEPSVYKSTLKEAYIDQDMSVKPTTPVMKPLILTADTPKATNTRAFNSALDTKTHPDIVRVGKFIMIGSSPESFEKDLTVSPSPSPITTPHTNLSRASSPTATFSRPQASPPPPSAPPSPR